MKDTLGEGNKDNKGQSSSSTPEMGKMSDKGVASEKGSASEKGGASEKGCASEKACEKNESSTASGSKATLEEGDVVSRGDLKRVMVDFHNTLETGNRITNCNEQALVKLLGAGYQVCVCSWCFRNRAREVQATLDRYPWVSRVWKIKCTEKRTNDPESKSSLCRAWAIKALFDDSKDILEETLEKGVACYPIKTKWEDHMWFKNHGKADWPRKLKKTKERAQPLEGPHKPLEEGSP